MIRIDLLRRYKKHVVSSRSFPWKIVLVLLLLAIIGGGLFLFLNRARETTVAVKVMRKKEIVPLKKEVTPYDVVEDIVEDIQGGRFKVESLHRLSSPANLSYTEKKIYERFFVKNTFDIFNACIQPGMGFNTITLDNQGNFFIFGVSPDAKSVHAFQKILKGQDAILSADTLHIWREMGESRLLFALKGFLSFNIIDRFYEEDTWNEKETVPASSKTVLADMMRCGKAAGITGFKKMEWGEVEPYGAYRQYRLLLQLECPYGALMKWIRAMYEDNLQIGYPRISLTSTKGDKVLTAIEFYLFAKN
ncbi:MAG: hypothetical protein A2293_08295 [Elusimicrobia bacterium RIFOXYB2_FULL_49_7]|nr:MAG: hypothetical protein A2293_08295 [Elusimicrobia bacterium RIFOXYB2_FULL_49_7]